MANHFGKVQVKKPASEVPTQGFVDDRPMLRTWHLGCWAATHARRRSTNATGITTSEDLRTEPSIWHHSLTFEGDNADRANETLSNMTEGRIPTVSLTGKNGSPLSKKALAAIATVLEEQGAECSITYEDEVDFTVEKETALPVSMQHYYDRSGAKQRRRSASTESFVYGSKEKRGLFHLLCDTIDDREGIPQGTTICSPPPQGPGAKDWVNSWSSMPSTRSAANAQANQPRAAIKGDMVSIQDQDDVS